MPETHTFTHSELILFVEVVADMQRSKCVASMHRRLSSVAAFQEEVVQNAPSPDFDKVLARFKEENSDG